MPNKKINSGILKLYHSDNIRRPIKYYQPMMDKVFNKPVKDNFCSDCMLNDL